ncbi:UNVERIFIED_CONTAM: hypothetical protein LK11_16090 [Mumia flava]
MDLGAGDGAITRHLVDAGARVLAVEKHPRRAAALRERFDGSGVTVVPADLRDLRLPRRPFRVVANPPFSLTSASLRLLLAPGSALVGAHLVLQRQAARTIVERGVAVRRAGRWRFELGRTLPRRAFTPRPRVDTVVLVVRRR